MIQVVIADDSAFLRQVLKDVLEEQDKISVVATAKNGKEAIACVKEYRPDLLILDCEMPVMNGLEALRRIMEECPLPVFMFSSLTREGASVTIKALEYGAVDFLLKPTAGAHALHEIAADLVRKIEVIVLKQRFARLQKSEKTTVAPPKPAVDIATLKKRTIDIIAMGSSTGGVQAATTVVSALPKQIPPLVWVQHMPPNFTLNFAKRLDSLSQVTVKEAENGDVLEPGVCYLAPGGFQMEVQRFSGRYRLYIAEGEKVSGHCPSCNVLFDSVQQYFTDNALGVILTGMGDDGAKGLKKMHEKGAYVVGQNEETCVVYGMPKSAYILGAVDIELPIEKIAAAIERVG